MKFEWDEEKRLTNLRLHGIDFADAVKVFDFETATEIDETIRIISVRNGDKNDEEKFFKEVRD